MIIRMLTSYTLVVNIKILWVKARKRCKKDVESDGKIKPEVSLCVPPSLTSSIITIPFCCSYARQPKRIRFNKLQFRRIDPDELEYV